MASIHREIEVAASADDIWDALRDVGAVHTRLARGFVTDCRLDGEDDERARIVSFANGMVVRELIVDVDDERRRLVWSVVGSRMTHHNASMQVMALAPGRSRVLWIADLLPHDLAGTISAMIEAGLSAMKKTLEAPA